MVHQFSSTHLYISSAVHMSTSPDDVGQRGHIGCQGITHKGMLGRGHGEVMDLVTWQVAGAGRGMPRGGHWEVTCLAVSMGN